MKAASRKGFTLIEILIVVIILGILAAIVIPQFTNASEEARKSSLASQLQTVRSAVELYKLHHGDSYPAASPSGATAAAAKAAWSWTSMLTTSLSYDGKTVGPYLQQTPVNPLNNQTALGGTASSSVGWVLDDTGRIFAVDKNGSLTTY